MKSKQFLTLLISFGMLQIACTDESDPIDVTTITLNVPTLQLAVGEESTLTATVLPDNATDQTVTWTSSDVGVATVDPSGKVKAVASGIAVVTAKAGNLSAICDVTVSSVRDTQIMLTNGSFKAGDVLSLGATGSYGFPLISNYTVGEATSWDNYEIVGNGGALTFIAWHPVGIVNPGGEYFHVAMEENPDLLLTDPVTVNKGEAVRLTFRHAMHQLVVKLSSSVYNATQLAGAVVKLDRFMMRSTAVVDFQHGTAFAHSDYNTEYPARTGSNCSFIIAPQDLHDEGHPWINIEINGKTYTYPVPVSLPGNDASIPLRLGSGSIRTLNLSLDSNAVTLASTTISEWEVK